MKKIVRLCIFFVMIFSLTSCEKSVEEQIVKQLELGQKYLVQMKYEDAIVAFSKVLELEPRHMEAYLGLAQAYFEDGQDEDALEVLEDAQKELINSYDPDEDVFDEADAVLKWLKELYESAGREKEADRVQKQLAAVKNRDIKQLKAVDEEPETEAEPTTPPNKGLSEKELLTIMENTTGQEVQYYTYVDMDHDGSEELIGVVLSGDIRYNTWYCSSDGTECYLLSENNQGMDECDICILDLEQETHVVVNAYCYMGTVKNYSIFALHNKKAECLVTNQYGFVHMVGSDILLNVEAYDGMYDPSAGGMLGHTWKDTYLFYDGKTYKEYGAAVITEAEFLQYKNAAEAKKKIEQYMEMQGEGQTEFSYFLRSNGIIHVQCDRYQDDSISYSYYTLRYEGKRITDIDGESISGIMGKNFSTLEVVYPEIGSNGPQEAVYEGTPAGHLEKVNGVWGFSGVIEGYDEARIPEGGDWTEGYYEITEGTYFVDDNTKVVIETEDDYGFPVAQRSAEEWLDDFYARKEYWMHVQLKVSGNRILEIQGVYSVD